MGVGVVMGREGVVVVGVVVVVEAEEEEGGGGGGGGGVVLLTDSHVKPFALSPLRSVELRVSARASILFCLTT